jgi:histidyl-tRNA synthetase
MGMERLVLMLEACDRLPDERGPDLYVVAVGDAAQLAAIAGVEALRDRCPGLQIVTQLGGGSFRSQMKKADRSGAQLALLWGEDEVAAGEVTLKPLRGDQEQYRLSLSALADTVMSMLEQQTF